MTERYRETKGVEKRGALHEASASVPSWQGQAATLEKDRKLYTGTSQFLTAFDPGGTVA